MWSKIKEFFEKKVVKIVEGTVIALASAGLLIGGVNAETIAKLPVLTLGVLTALESIITFIQAFSTKK